MLHNCIRSTGSHCPWMYALPKVHKERVPLRHILSMLGSVQTDIACCFLNNISDLYSSVDVHFSDFFRFSNLIRDHELCSTDKVMVSFHIVYLQTYLFRLPYRYVRMSFMVSWVLSIIIRVYTWNLWIIYRVWGGAYSDLWYYICSDLDYPLSVPLVPF